MSVQTIDISIIIVNYKGWQHLKECLHSLVRIKTKVFKFETIVVDNCSNDGQLEIYIQEFKTVNFYQNTGNNGFANACNFGALQAKGNYLLFLNPDTITNKEALETLLKTAQENQNYGIISCQQYKEHNKHHNHDKLFLAPQRMFGFLRAIDKFINAKQFKTRFGSDKKIIYPDWVSGSVVFMSRSWFDSVGGWCDDYWMYYEDVDLCKRVSLAGGKIALLKEVGIIHYHGGSTRINYRTKALTKTEVIISRHVYIHKHIKGLTGVFMQSVNVIYQLFVKFIMAFFGAVLFFIPKFKVHILLAVNMYKYYAELPFKRRWLSQNSLSYKK